MRRIDNSTSSSGYIRISENTPLSFYYKSKAYQHGKVGTKTAWIKYSCFINQAEQDVFWCEWRGSYGTQQLKAMSLGVVDLCTIRMDYHPEIYNLLRSREVIVIKNASPTAVDAAGAPVISDPDVYSLWGAVDDIRNRRRIMEFQVRRYEAK